MAKTELTNGTTTVTLTDDEPETNVNSDEMIADYPLIGTHTGEVEDLETFSDIITITCTINDVSKYNNIQTLRKSTGTITFKWNDNETTKPMIDHASAVGTVVVKISGVSLRQKPGYPVTRYEMTIKLRPSITV